MVIYNSAVCAERAGFVRVAQRVVSGMLVESAAQQRVYASYHLRTQTRGTGVPLIFPGIKETASERAGCFHLVAPLVEPTRPPTPPGYRRYVFFRRTALRP